MRLILILALLSVLALPVMAYDNDSRDASGTGLIRGGPHRTINEFALERWLSTCQDETVKRYKLLSDYRMMGPTVVEPGMEIVTTEDRAGSLGWWVAEGGYDADEPELYNSFRHFYDPRALDGAPYLTDHLDALNYVYRALIFTSKIGRVVSIVAGSTVNPEVNARDWALTGEKHKGWDVNYYCWNKGREYMKQAFAETDGVKKQKLFAQAWRSLGETMHLMADMACVPHVRNDSHPGKAIGYKVIGNTDPNVGYLKHDPYELMANEALVRASRDASLDPRAKETIDEAKSPKELFDNLAYYTQDHFFSADTIGGTYVVDRGKPTQREVSVTPANGKKRYPFPVLKSCDFDEKTGYFTREINGRPVKLCHVDWMSSIGWGDPKKNGPVISRECVVEQAGVLVPAAIYANTRLVDWFVPRLELQITSIDPDSKALAATMTHRTYGAHTETLAYTQSPGQEYRLWVNGSLQPRGAFTLNIVDSAVTGTLNLSNLKKGDTVALGVGVGGLLVKSPEYVMGEKAKEGEGRWVLDAVVPENRHEESKDKWGSEIRDAKVSEGGGSTYERRVFNGINRHEHTFNYSFTWTTPPPTLAVGQQLTLRVAVKEGECSGSGDDQFYHNRWGDVHMGASLNPSRAAQERAKQKGYTNVDWGSNVLGRAEAHAFCDTYRPSDTVTSAEQSVTVTIPAPTFNDQELVIGFSVGGNNEHGGIVFYYRWEGPRIPDPPQYEDACVSAGTLVMRADGTRVPIEQIRPGDRIAAFDQAKGEPAIATVERLIVHAKGPYSMQRLVMQGGRTLTLTANHPVFTALGNWVPVERLAVGAGVCVLDPARGGAGQVTVLSIVRDQGSESVVYNLKTSLGDYYANDILIHNKCLAAGSRVDTPDGPCSVERLRVGQMVYGSVNGRRVATPVTHVYAKRTVLPSLPGKRLTPHVAATVNHRVWDGSAFRTAGGLACADEAIAGTVYDVQTSAGNYYADGVLMTASE